MLFEERQKALYNSNASGYSPMSVRANDGTMFAMCKTGNHPSSKIAIVQVSAGGTKRSIACERTFANTFTAREEALRLMRAYERRK